MPTLCDKKRAVEISHEIQQNISNYLFSVSLINVGLGLVVSAGLYLLGVPNAAMWGMLVALLNFVPYFGPVAGILLLAAVGLLTFNTLWQAVLPSAWYLVLHLLEANLITPVLLGRRFTLNPVVIFVSLIFWTWLWGVPGALLSVRSGLDQSDLRSRSLAVVRQRTAHEVSNFCDQDSFMRNDCQVGGCGRPPRPAGAGERGPFHSRPMAGPATRGGRDRERALRVLSAATLDARGAPGFCPAGSFHRRRTGLVRRRIGGVRRHFGGGATELLGRGGRPVTTGGAVVGDRGCPGTRARPDQPRGDRPQRQRHDHRTGDSQNRQRSPRP